MYVQYLMLCKKHNIIVTRISILARQVSFGVDLELKLLTEKSTSYSCLINQNKIIFIIFQLILNQTELLFGI